MYEQQLWYWPEKQSILCLCVYLDGSYAIHSEDMKKEECEALLRECFDQVMEVDDYLFVKGLTFLDHIPTE